MITKFPSLFHVAFSGIGKLAFLGVMVLLYKSLSAANIGLFAIAYAIAVILATISELGLRGLLVREMARSHDSPDASKHLLSGALQSRFLTLLPYFGFGFLAGLLFMPDNQWTILSLLLAAAWLDSNAFVFRGALRAYDFLILDGLMAGGSRIILLSLTTFLYWQHQLTLLNFAILFTLVACADVVVTLCVVAGKTRIQISTRGSLQKTYALIRRGIPFILLNIIGILYMRIGLLLLGVSHSTSGLDEAAAFSLSGRIPEGVSFLPIALMNAAIPFFARNCGNLNAITPMFRKLELVMGTAGIIISAGLIIFAEQFILILATPEYLPYKTVFQVYGLTVFFTFLQYVYGNLLICMDQENRVARRYGIVLILNVMLNLLLVWKFQALGAVVALLLCEMTALAIDMRFMIKSGIHPEPALLLKWGGLTVTCWAMGWAANQFPYPYNMAAYWFIGGLVGVVVLLKNPLSHEKSAGR